MTTIELTGFERINIFSILEGRQPQNAKDYRLIGRLMDKMELTQEEKKELGYREVPVPGSGGTVMRIIPEGTVDDRRGVKLEDQEFDRLKQIFEGPVENLNQGHRKWLNPVLDRLGL